MRRRITFVQRPDTPFSLDQAVLTPDALSIHELDSVREERATFSFDELPSELWDVLKQCHQLHIRWASEKRYDTVAPFSSRVSPGLHVFFTPVADSSEENKLCVSIGLGYGCALLKRVFDAWLKCTNPEESFITPPILSTRFASTAAFQYHSLLPSLDNLVTYIENKICPSSDQECLRHAASIRSADSVDINYDSISHSLTVLGYWSRSPGKGWTDEIRKHPAGTDQVEVGLLGTEMATEPEDIKMGGLLGDVGKDDQLSMLYSGLLKPALFSFPSRHHPLPEDATYSISFTSPTGLHPIMTISLPPSSLKPPPAPPGATCALHTYLTLPSSIFGDKYQLSTTDPLFLNSHNLAALRAVAGETDLEAPDWSVSHWGSNWLLELATPAEFDQVPPEWNVTVPLHLRYLPPSESGYRSAAVPWPVVFWACTAEDGTKMGVNPFDRVNLGWEGLFGTRTMFYQLHPSSDRLVEELEVPVLQLNDEGFFQSKVIELGTVIAIGLGLLWVLWKLGLVARSSEPRPQNRNNKQEKTE
ncbi:protein pbn1 [Aspergillus coremiiformis]|uniref:Protein PBN1 n=1 Tax=Aspergillus coremiiformis TaxID=138285 RepID=A0A5N6Z9G9_9EURO|nr:protein pbn1 [Aspergillus coremiiformis]